MGNRARAAELLDLLTVGLNGRANERAFAKAIRIFLEGHHGRAAAQAAPARRRQGRTLALHLTERAAGPPALSEDLCYPGREHRPYPRLVAVAVHGEHEGCLLVAPHVSDVPPVEATALLIWHDAARLHSLSTQS